MASDLLELQKNEYDCGPACLLVVMKMNGIKANRKDVVKLAGTTPESGTLAEGIVRVLATYGFGAKVWNTKKLAEVRPYMGKRPMILSVDNGNHWVVLLSVYNNFVVFFDPWCGTSICGLKKFSKRWKHSDGCFYAIDAGMQ